MSSNSNGVAKPRHRQGQSIEQPTPSSSSSPFVDSSRYAEWPSFFTRLRYAVVVYGIQYLIAGVLPILKLPYLSTYTNVRTKTYPSHPQLQHRFFTPPAYKEGDPPLPLYIDIHGGGFAWGAPVADDKWCHTASKENVLVVSLAYPLAPQHRFPTAKNALISIINSILEDESLPFDRSKVAIGGFSAGANLAFSTSQHESLQGRIHGLVAFYPPTNFSAVARVPEGVVGAGEALSQDQLNMFSWAYVLEGQDLHDPTLSPRFAERRNLPPKLCIIGCELDLLCESAERMTEQLAGRPSDEDNRELIWEQNGVRWEKVVGEDHGTLYDSL